MGAYPLPPKWHEYFSLGNKTKIFIEVEHHKTEASLAGSSLFLRFPSQTFFSIFLELCPGLLLPTHYLTASVREDVILSKTTPFRKLLPPPALCLGLEGSQGRAWCRMVAYRSQHRARTHVGAYSTGSNKCVSPGGLCPRGLAKH